MLSLGQHKTCSMSKATETVVGSCLHISFYFSFSKCDFILRSKCMWYSSNIADFSTSDKFLNFTQTLHSSVLEAQIKFHSERYFYKAFLAQHFYLLQCKIPHRESTFFECLKRILDFLIPDVLSVWSILLSKVRFASMRSCWWFSTVLWRRVLISEVISCSCSLNWGIRSGGVIQVTRSRIFLSRCPGKESQIDRWWRSCTDLYSALTSVFV